MCFDCLVDSLVTHIPRRGQHVKHIDQLRMNGNCSFVNFRSVLGQRRAIEPDRQQGVQAWHTHKGSSGLLIDTGAPEPLTGSVFVRGHVKEMEQRGFKAKRTDLPVPEYMRGVGKGAQKCPRK